jgi:hypothetical protein
MSKQLVLPVSTSPNWKIDPKTREIGRRGIAEARAALRRAGAGSGPSGHPRAA